MRFACFRWRADASCWVIGLTLKTRITKKILRLKHPSNMSPWSSFSAGTSVRLAVALLFFPATSFLKAQSVGGQNFVARSGSLSPFGANGALPFGQALGFVTNAGIKGGFSSGISLSSLYDSNFFQDSGGGEEEVTFTLTPSLSYTTDPEGGAPLMLAASYSPSANWYFNNPDLDGFNQGGSVSAVISGSKTVISMYASYSVQSGVDRLAGGFLTGSALSVGFRASYQLAPRTSIYASFTPTIVDYEQGSLTGFSDYAMTVGGFWAATELLSVGPSIGYSTSSSDNTGDFDSWSLSGNVNYQATMRISLAASLGLQVSSYSQDSSSNMNATGNLNASYRINELWALSNSIQSGLTPSPNQTNYVINNWSISSMLSRSLLIGSAGIGVDLQFSSFDQVGPTSVSQENEQNLGLVLSYSRPVFLDRVNFHTSLRYALNKGQEESSQVLVNLGLSYSF